jgi:putative intracellular protease/amidase
MPVKAVYLLVVPGFADWEAAHAIAELRRHGGYRVEVVGLSSDPVESMGGVMVRPSQVVTEVDPGDVALFILPGGDRWEQMAPEPELVRLLTALDASRVPIAAICAATTVVVRTGLLHGRRHTSNGLAYLSRQVPEYSEAARYVDTGGRDRGLSRRVACRMSSSLQRL